MGNVEMYPTIGKAFKIKIIYHFKMNTKAQNFIIKT